MKLSNINLASIPKAKVVDYLLSPTHHQGKGKATFFTAHGFSRDQWTVFADALRHHARIHEISGIEESPFGLRLKVDGVLPTPTGENLLVRTVWFMDKGKETPRFVTAYPLKRHRP